MNTSARVIADGRERVVVGDGEVPLPGYTWQSVWSLLKSIAPARDTAAETHNNDDGQTGNQQPSEEQRPRGRRPDRAEIANSDSLHILNAVLHPNYTIADRNRDQLADRTEWEKHFKQECDRRGALWLIHLPHFEGELAVGLGKRTFSESSGSSKWGIQWFMRKSSDHHWGVRTTAFKMAISHYDPSRRAVPMTSEEPQTSLIPIPVQLTSSCRQAEPVLSQACMAALREWAAANGAAQTEGNTEEGAGENRQGGAGEGRWSRIVPTVWTTNSF